VGIAFRAGSYMLKKIQTGKGKLGKRHITVHAVVNEADAHALRFNFHA
jgi:hypothetical protein